MNSQRTRTAPLALLLFAALSCGDSPLENEAAGRRYSELVSSTPVVVSYKKPVEERVSEVVLDQQGGKIEVYDHVLTVPKNAVAEPTLFRFRALAGTHVVFELNAVRVRDGYEMTTFNKPLTLRLAYREVDAKPERLTVAYLPEDSVAGAIIPIKSSVDTGSRLVSTELHHFSSYAMAMN